MGKIGKWQKKLRIQIGIGAVAGGLALTMIMAPQLVFAQEESPSGEQVAASNTQHGPGRGGKEFLAEALGISVEELEVAYEAAHEAGEESDIDRQTLLATELGITVDELDVAQDTAFGSALDQAVEDDKLTEEEAELKQAEHDLSDYIDRQELLADVLGITVEELDAARNDGIKLPDLLEELGLDQETLNEDLETAYEEAVTQAVEDEIISQDQADEILSEDTPPHGDQPRGHQSQNDREQEDHRGPGSDHANADSQGEEDGDGDTSAVDGDDSAEAASTDSGDDESGRLADDDNRPQRGPGLGQGGGRR